jgi:hypothetical protein
MKPERPETVLYILIALALLLITITGGSCGSTNETCDDKIDRLSLQFAQTHPKCSDIGCTCAGCWCIAEAWIPTREPQ